MIMNLHRRSSAVLVALVLAIISVSPSTCFGTNRRESLSDGFRSGEAVLWGRRTQPGNQDDTSVKKTEYEILAIAKDSSKEYKVGQKIVVELGWNGRQTSTFILFKLKSKLHDEYVWLDSGPVNREAWDYTAGTPSLKLPQSQRLPYYVKHLNSSVDFIKYDVHAEFTHASLTDLVGIKDQLDREMLRKWLSEPDPNESAYQKELYGVLLGVCGNEQDASLLLSMIEDDADNRFMYMRGIVTGYLLLTGEKGIAKLEEIIWNAKHSEFQDVYFVMTAFNYLLESPPENLPRNQLLSTLRKLLKRPDVTDLIISSLAKAEDWEILDDILKLYDDKAYDQPNIKREIVRYLLTCENSWKETDSSEKPDYVATAQQALARIEQDDPKTVRDAKRFFRLR